MQKDRPIVLSIAGFDPCGGAGILADVKTFEQLNTLGMGIITANTLQTEDQFFKTEWVALETILDSIQTLMKRYPISIVKIGIVKDFSFLNAIVQQIRKVNPNAFIIWDPVLESSSGFRFFQEEDLEKLPKVFAKINLLTPNYLEFLKIKPFLNTNTSMGILVKGGHQKNNLGVDVLHHNHQETSFSPNHLNISDKHGSGCVLSSAIAAHLALGKDIKDACQFGKNYVESFLNSHPSLLGFHHV